MMRHRGDGLIRDLLVIAGATLLSRLFGLVRDAVIADRFGTSAAYDAYIIAFFIPFVLRRLLAEGALQAAFIPIYTGYLAEDREEADRFASSVLSLLLLLFPALIAVGIWLAPHYVGFLADGFPPGKLQLAVLLTRVMLPFIGLVGFAAVFTGVLHGQRHFLAPALAPVMFNLGVIAGAWLLTTHTHFAQPIFGLAVGVLLGGGGMLLLQVPYLRGRLRFRFALPLSLDHPGLRRLGWMMLPAVLGLAGEQLNVMVDNKLASHLGDGAIASLQYAVRLFQLPLGVFAVSISNALLPRLSQLAASGDRRQLGWALQRGLLLAWAILLPAMAGLYALGRPVIQLLFEHGSFGPEATARTLYALRFYLVGLVGYGSVYTLTKAFYALYDTRTPVLIGLGAVAVNVGLDLALIGPLGTGGLALATSIAGLVNMALLGWALSRRLELNLLRGLARPVLRAAVGAGGMGLLVSLLYSWLERVLTSELLLVGLPVIFGLGVYLLFARWSGLLREALTPLPAPTPVPTSTSTPTPTPAAPAPGGTPRE